jgi:hypothetical protein
MYCGLLGPCSLFCGHKTFGETYRLHLQGITSTFVTTYKTIRRQNPDHSPYFKRSENLKSHTFWFNLKDAGITANVLEELNDEISARFVSFLFQYCGFYFGALKMDVACMSSRNVHFQIDDYTAKYWFVLIRDLTVAAVE